MILTGICVTAGPIDPTRLPNNLLPPETGTSTMSFACKTISSACFLSIAFRSTTISDRNSGADRSDQITQQSFATGDRYIDDVVRLQDNIVGVLPLDRFQIDNHFLDRKS